MFRSFLFLAFALWTVGYAVNASAQAPTFDLGNSVVHFGGQQWYVIESSDSYARLLAKNDNGQSVFGVNHIYEGSTLQSHVQNIAKQFGKHERSVAGALSILSSEELETLSGTALTYEGGDYWLRDPSIWADVPQTAAHGTTYLSETKVPSERSAMRPMFDLSLNTFKTWDSWDSKFTFYDDRIISFNAVSNGVLDYNTAGNHVKLFATLAGTDSRIAINGFDLSDVNWSDYFDLSENGNYILNFFAEEQNALLFSDFYSDIEDEVVLYVRDGEVLFREPSFVNVTTPEPATVLIFCLGLTGLFSYRYGKKRVGSR